MKKKRTPKTLPIPEDMKVLEEKPPIYKSVCQFLGYKDVQAFFTYGDTIYNPAKLQITGDVVVHEKLHMKQQTDGYMTPALWWGKFLRDPQFRIDQEAKAYGAQLRALKTIKKDRNEQTRILHRLALILAGDLYGNAIDYGSAMLLIKSYSN